MQQEAGRLHHSSIHAPGGSRKPGRGEGADKAGGGAGKRRGQSHGDGETALLPSSPRCCHLCTPQRVWGLCPKVSGSSPPHPTDEVSEDPGRGCGWPSPAPGPPFREPDPYPAGVPAPVDPGKGCGWPSPAPGPQGPVDPEFSSVSDSGGSVVGREMGWIPGQRGLCNIPFFFRKNENIGDVNVH